MFDFLLIFLISQVFVYSLELFLCFMIVFYRTEKLNDLVSQGGEECAINRKADSH